MTAAATTSSAARAAFLRCLVRENFVPEESSVAEANARAEMSLPLTPEAERDANRQLARDIEKFALSYWSMPTSERSIRWHELSAQNPPAPYSYRLEALAAGLELEPANHGDPDSEELAEAIRELYVLPRRERAIRCEVWLVDQIDRMPAYVVAALVIRQEDPLLASLEPLLIEKILDSQIRIETAEEVADRSSRLSRDVREFSRRVASHERTSRSRVNLSNIERSIVLRYKLFFVVLLLTVAAAIGMRAYYSTQPERKVTFTHHQVRRFWSFDPKSNQPPPPGYHTWKLMGKPAASTDDASLSKGAK